MATKNKLGVTWTLADLWEAELNFKFPMFYTNVQRLDDGHMFIQVYYNLELLITMTEPAYSEPPESIIAKFCLIVPE